ncbi:hypothetical protein MTO96_047935 [Rhipicephalus appendiculatus]
MKRLLCVATTLLVACKSRGDPVLRHLRELFAEEDIRPIYIGSDHTSSRLLDYADEHPRIYNYRLLFGVIFTDQRNAPLLVNLYHSALLRNITGRPAARFVLVNQPYSNETARRRGRADSGEKHDRQLLLQRKLSFAGDTLLVEVLMGTFTPLALCFHAASFVVFPITELCSQFKHLQLMTGVSGILYWLSNFIFDTVLAVACAFIFVPTVCYSHRYLRKPAYIALPSRNSSSAGIVDGGRNSMVEPYELSCAVMIEAYVMLAEAVLFLAFVAFMDATPYARLRRRLFGECLGIIGVTGSGKTKLMQLLTGSSECSSGDVYIGSWSLLRTPRAYASNIRLLPRVCRHARIPHRP